MENTTFRGIKKVKQNEAKVILTGLAFDGNASIGKGASEAPNLIRKLSKNIPPVTRDGALLNGTTLYDCGDFIIHDQTIEQYFKRVYDHALNMISVQQFNIFIGGDHSVNIPTTRAFIDVAKTLDKIPVLIHIDAHPDLMDVYLDNYYSHATPTRRALDYGLLPQNLVFIGLRGFETAEVEYFKANPLLNVYLASDVRKLDVKRIIDQLKNKFNSEKYLIYVSYDIDANDPSFAPGTGTPEAFGLTSLETLELVTSLCAMKNTVALDLVEVSPPLDQNNITSWLALKTLYEVFYEIERRKR